MENIISSTFLFWSAYVIPISARKVFQEEEWCKVSFASPSSRSIYGWLFTQYNNVASGECSTMIILASLEDDDRLCSKGLMARWWWRERGKRNKESELRAFNCWIFTIQLNECTLYSLRHSLNISETSILFLASSRAFQSLWGESACSNLTNSTFCRHILELSWIRSELN